MDDAMLDLMADRGGLRRRLDAYAEDRLSPDLGATTRMRSRVLAVAHRQSALSRSDVTLALVPDPIDLPGSTARPAASTTRRRVRTLWRRSAALVLAAGLATAAVSGAALAAKPGGGLYGARVWAETLLLPMQQPERAIAELDRLHERLREIADANARGDTAAAISAVQAYQSIVAGATDDVVRSGDDVAEAALERGVANNIQVLTALIDKLPDRASQAVGAALERAIERSNDAVESIKPGHGSGGDGSNAGGNGDGSGEPGDPNATAAPAATEAPVATPTPKPTKTPKPDATPKPTAPPKPEPTPKATQGDQGGGNQGGGQGPGENNRAERTPRPDPPGKGD